MYQAGECSKLVTPSVLVSLFRLPQSGCCTHLWASEAPVYPSWSPNCEADSQVEPFSLTAPSQWHRSHPNSFFFLTLFPPAHYAVIFLATFTVYLLPAFSQYSVRTGLCVDVFLMSLWEEVSLLFYSVILVSSLKLGSLASFKIMWRPCNILTPNNTTSSVYVLSIQEFSSFSIPLKLDIITTLFIQ